MPYRLDADHADDSAIERLIDLGALDVERTPGGGVAALLPDSVDPADVARAIGVDRVGVSRVSGDDDGSVWRLGRRSIDVGGLSIARAGDASPPDALLLIDSPVFGTGLHPTTALCMEALQQAIDVMRPGRMLDAGTGSGILAIAALRLGVPRAVAIDIDPAAVAAAAENARINGVAARLSLVCGDVETIAGTFPLVVANILAAPLIEMAPTLSRRVGGGGRLILSGIPDAVADEVRRAYVRGGMRATETASRGGWAALVLDAGW